MPFSSQSQMLGTMTQGKQYSLKLMREGDLEMSIE